MRSLIPVLAITLGLMVTAPAVAQPADQGVPSSAVATQDLRAPDRTAPGSSVSSAVATQDLRAPDRTAPGSSVSSAVATQDLRAPDRTVPALAQAPASTSDGGLSTALILLLAVGGAVVLAATAVVGTRYAQAHGHLHRQISG
jgi:hypothetical protein